MTVAQTAVKLHFVSSQTGFFFFFFFGGGGDLGLTPRSIFQLWQDGASVVSVSLAVNKYYDESSCLAQCSGQSHA